MRAATCSVGLVSPRSTWLSIGAETPERAASSRSDRSIASRRARMRGPRAGTAGSTGGGAAGTAIGRAYAIAYVCLSPGAAGSVPTMAPPLSSVPDVLVLGAGGTLGIAWLRGMVAGIEDAGGPDLRRAEYLIGTSAGSYVAAALAAGRPVDAAGADPGTVADAGAAVTAADGADGGGPGEDGPGLV